nr:hypothetical protein [Tanacetum cinerariifolium]
DENYLFNLCGNNSHDGYDCQQQFPFKQEPGYNQNYDDNYYPQISNEENFQAKGDLMKSIQTFLERFNCIPFEEKPQILFRTWETFFAIQCSQPEDSNELFQKLLKDLKELAKYDQSTSTDRPIFPKDNEDHLVQNKESPKNSSEENVVLKTNQEPPQDSNMHQLIDECCEEVPEEQKQKMEDMMLNLVKIFAPILSTKEPENSLSIRYEHLSITPEIESDEVTESNAENLLPIPSECEVTLEDKRECNELICENSSTNDVCDNHSEILFDSNNDDLSSNDKSFKDIEYVDASVLNPAIVSIEEEKVVQREEKKLIKKIFLKFKTLFFSDNSLLDNYSPEFETFYDHSEETRSGNTTHANYSLPEYDLFRFEIEPDQERLINLVENDNSDDSSNNPLLEEVDLFLSDDSIPPGIENVADDPEGDVRFLEELLIDDSILSHESFDSNFEENPSNLRPPPEPPDDNFDLEPEVISALKEDIDEPDEHFNPGGEIFVSTNNENVDYFLFMFVIRIFLPYLIFPEISPFSSPLRVRIRFLTL